VLCAAAVGQRTRFGDRGRDSNNKVRRERTLSAGRQAVGLFATGRAGCLSEQDRRSREQTKQRISELFRHGDTQGNAPGSKWAAVNAIVDYGDWHRPIRQGGERFARPVDAGAAKTRALELISAS
jgi:hypothetical protein